MRAILYHESKSGDGTITLKPITSARYLSVPQIASTLGVSVQTIYRHIDAGSLRAIRIGCIVRVPLEDYREWMDGRAMAEYERPPRRAS